MQLAATVLVMIAVVRIVLDDANRPRRT